MSGDRNERLRAACVFIAGCALAGCEAIVNDGSLKERPAGGGAQSSLPDEAGTSDVIDAGGSVADLSDGRAEADDGGTAQSPSGANDASGSVPDDEGAVVGDEPAPDGGAAGEDSGPAPDGGAAGKDSGPAPDATAPDDAGPHDASPADSPAAESGAAPAGCSPGAVVIPMTKLNTTYKFNTVASVCVTYKGYVSGWNGSNMQGRSVTVVGAMTRTLPTIAENAVQPSVAPSSDGYIYWNFSIGMYAYSSMDAFP